MKSRLLSIVLTATAAIFVTAFSATGASAQSTSCKVTKSNAEFMYSSSEKVVKLKKGTALRIVMFGGQGVVVVRAKIGTKWYKGEIKAEETSCQ